MASNLIHEHMHIHGKLVHEHLHDHEKDHKHPHLAAR
jgi:cobalt/nickel transport system ATP-binding protein